MNNSINYKNFTTLPIQNRELWDLYKKQESSFWRAEEVDLSGDMRDWVKLNPDEQFFIKNILAFFAGSDGIVNWNISKRFKEDAELIQDRFKEAKYLYNFQAMIEDVHGFMYSLLIDTYISDSNEKEHLFNAIENIPCVKKKAEWAMRWIVDTKSSFSQRLVAFSIVEGIFFSGSFCAIYWLKKRGLMPGLTSANEFIARDEGMHVQFACEIYKLLVNKLPADVVYELIDDGVKVAKNFMEDALPIRLIGMNSDSMSEYIQCVADRLLVDLGYKKFYNTPNPFSFMETIGMAEKTNFFESRPTSYQSAFNQESKRTNNLETFEDDF